jgi:signal transduction histidine kinase
MVMTLARRLQMIAAAPDRLLWAVRVRWLVIGGFLGLAVVAWQAGILSSPEPCLRAAIVGGLLNAVNHLCVHRRRCLSAVTAVAVPLDHLLITYVVANTGGVESPFIMMCFVQVVATAMLVDTVVAVFGAVCAVTIWVVGLDLLDGGWLPAARLIDRGNDGTLRALWGAFLVYCLGLLVYVGGYIGRRLRSSELDLEDKNRRLLEALDSLRTAYERLKRAESHLIQSEKMRALGQLVAGIAHELNNPISFIWANIEHLRAYTGLMAETLRAAGPADAGGSPLSRALADLPSLLDDCEEGARRAKQIVAQLRTFSRHEDGTQWCSTDLARDIGATVHLLSHRLNNGISVHTDLACRLEVDCLPGQINQVLMNLLVNSIDAIDDRGGNIWITARVDASLGEVILTVRDDGPGMSAEVRDRIFDPFFTTKGVGQGTGLGLAVSYAIVARHRGRIEVQSRVGEGSCFTVVLPLRHRREEKMLAEGNSVVDSRVRPGYFD